MKNYSTENYQSQVQAILRKLATKKKNNASVIKWLESIREKDKAERIESCGEHIGITNLDDTAHIVKADFCRERLCFVCAWRRQSRFLAQMYPVLSILNDRGYRFLFATLTIKNVSYNDLDETVNKLMHGYKKLIDRRKIKRSWLGITRSMELTYNEETEEFHPHIHLMIAVKEEYFIDYEKYISSQELAELWQSCIDVDYIPVVDIRAVSSTDKAAVETLKYSLKPTKAKKAFEAFFYVLRGRRLISFCGVFAKVRQELKYSDFDTILTDDIPTESKRKMSYELYKFDATGGIYNFSQRYELEI